MPTRLSGLLRPFADYVCLLIGTAKCHQQVQTQRLAVTLSLAAHKIPTPCTAIILDHFTYNVRTLLEDSEIYIMDLCRFFTPPPRPTVPVESPRLLLMDMKQSGARQTTPAVALGVP